MNLYSIEQVRKIEQKIIKSFNILAFDLMKKAGTFAFDTIIKHYPDINNITVICGMGNNGGDGYITASCAAQKGLEVRCLEVGDPEDQTNTARQAKEFALACGVSPLPYSAQMIPKNTLIVDALVGIGVKGNIKGSLEEAVKTINTSNNAVVAIDIPSGLDANTGEPLGQTIKAQLTVTFIASKKGLYLQNAKQYCGKVEYSNLGINPNVFEEFAPCYRLMDINLISKIQKKHSVYNAHKGQFGHLLIIGGDYGMGGAPVMAAQAALRMGTGKVSILTRPEHMTIALTRQPEIMVCNFENIESINLEDKSALVIGPGLGSWVEEFCPQILELDIPKVVDADALNWLSKNRKAKLKNAILTPHPGEAAKLLHWSTDEIQEDRDQAIKTLYNCYKSTTILKGHNTLMIDENQMIHLCPYGNPGMATPGMGDILSGIIGGIIAQGFTLKESLECAVTLHALAGDKIANQKGLIGLCATDLLDMIQSILNQ